MPPTVRKYVSVFLAARKDEGTDMKIIVVIPIEHYDPFLGKCAIPSPEYQMLKNGLITHGAGEKPVAVEIRCDLEKAKGLREFAARVYPDLVPSIEASIRIQRDQ
jgi:hypothetical protein